MDETKEFISEVTDDQVRDIKKAITLLEQWKNNFNKRIDKINNQISCLDTDFNTLNTAIKSRKRKTL